MDVAAPKFTYRQAVVEAFFHADEPHVVLGRRLDPFCLRHFLFLQAWRSPLIVGGAVSMEDLKTAVAVCSTSSPRELAKALHRKSLYWKVWSRLADRRSVDPAFTAFQDYLEDYFPEFPMYSQRGDDEGVPGLLVAGARCLGAAGVAGVKDMPLGEMLVWSMATAEANGHHFDNIMKQVDIDALREIAAEEAAAK